MFLSPRISYVLAAPRQNQTNSIVPMFHFMCSGIVAALAKAEIFCIFRQLPDKLLNLLWIPPPAHSDSAQIRSRADNVQSELFVSHLDHAFQSSSNARTNSLYFVRGIVRSYMAF